ncbi:porin [Caballeronia sp. NCTM5]|uniref:porin n=1 Tax=Caballeronia sp. NCTM5 TaxID=2921755 RepID=UPI0020294369
MTKLPFVCAGLLLSTSAFAQSSVTLYGLIDEGFGWTNNAGGNKAYQMQAGYVAGDRWGLKGVEDLGAGLSAIFTLENGFDLNSGRLGQSGRMFGRQAYVGLTSQNFGTVTFGRQYDSIVDYVAPLTANGGYGGFIFSHPFDNDNLDNSFRVNNAVKYSSINYGGFKFGGLYAFSNQAGGFANNRLYSVGASYAGAGLAVAAGYLQANSGGVNAGGAIATDDTNFVAQRQQIWGAAVTYTFGQVMAGVNYEHTALKNPVGSVYFGALPLGSTFLKFDNFEVFGKYQVTPALQLMAMYNFTEGSLDDATGTTRPKWHQAGLQADYFISKRTDVYAQGVYQHVRQADGTVFNEAYIAGAAAPSSSTSQLVLRVGIKHAF